MASEEGWVGIADVAAHLSVAKDSIECQMKDMAMVTQRLIEFLARDIVAIVLVFVLVQQITSNQEEKYTAREAEEESKTGPAGILARLIIGGT